MKRNVKNIKEKKSHVLAKKKDFKKREHTLSTKKKSGIQEKTITIKKIEGRKWKTQIRIDHFLHFLDAFKLVESTNDKL